MKEVEILREARLTMYQSPQRGEPAGNRNISVVRTVSLSLRETLASVPRFAIPIYGFLSNPFEETGRSEEIIETSLRVWVEL